MFTPEQRVFLVLLVTQAIRGIADKFGLILGGRVAIGAAVIVGTAIGGIEAYVSTLDPASQAQAKSVLMSVFGLLASMGLYDTVKLLAPQPPFIRFTDAVPLTSIKVGEERVGLPGHKPTAPPSHVDVPARKP